MSPLASLRFRLTVLRRARQLARWVSALSVLATSIMVACAILLATDLLFRLTKPQRLVTLALASGAMAWIVRRWALPLLGIHESVEQLALLVRDPTARLSGSGSRTPVGRLDGPDTASDVIGALQFDSPRAATWGSPALRDAVIRRVSSQSQALVFDRFPPRLLRRVGVALVLLAAAVALTFSFPAHAASFLRRMLLANSDYPSATWIEEAWINGQPIAFAGPAFADPSSGVRAVRGRPLVISVVARGKLPIEGQVRLFASTSRSERRLPLRRADAADSSIDERDSWDVTSLADSTSVLTGPSANYQARLARLSEPLDCQFFLGDASTRSIHLDVVDLPIVELVLSATPPAYARTDDEPAEASGQSIVVLQHSQVGVRLRSTNGKRLSEAWLTASTKTETRQHAFTAIDETGTQWELPIAGTALAEIVADVALEVQVRDKDGFELDSPIRGHIAPRADAPPVLAAAVIHQVVLPTARPVIEYRVADDHGIGRIELLAQVQRKAEEEETTTTGGDREALESETNLSEAAAIQQERHERSLLAEPILAAGLPFSGRYELDLSPWKLLKGDRLRITLQAVDYRGPEEGVAATSEPIFLEVSDEAGVLAAISTADEESEKQLTELIQRQLGIGEKK